LGQTTQKRSPQILGLFSLSAPKQYRITRSNGWKREVISTEDRQAAVMGRNEIGYLICIWWNGRRHGHSLFYHKISQIIVKTDGNALKRVCKPVWSSM